MMMSTITSHMKRENARCSKHHFSEPESVSLSLSLFLFFLSSKTSSVFFFASRSNAIARFMYYSCILRCITHRYRAFSKYNDKPGTGKTGYFDIPPNNYPFYMEDEKCVFFPLVYFLFSSFPLRSPRTISLHPSHYYSLSLSAKPKQILPENHPRWCQCDGMDRPVRPNSGARSYRPPKSLRSRHPARRIRLPPTLRRLPHPLLARSFRTPHRHRIRRPVLDSRPV
jgi:hypothetical protein